MSFHSYLGAIVEAEAASGASQKDLDKVIQEIIGIFKDPVVLYPGGWEDTLPARVWEMIRLERIIQQIKAKGKKLEAATDAEALAYLYSASMVAPMDHEWVNIYLWLGKDLMPEAAAAGIQAPKEISRNEVERLEDLKRWIHRKKTSGRKRGKEYPLDKPSKKRSSKKTGMGFIYEPEIVEAW